MSGCRSATAPAVRSEPASPAVAALAEAPPVTAVVLPAVQQPLTDLGVTPAALKAPSDAGAATTVELVSFGASEEPPAAALINPAALEPLPLPPGEAEAVSPPDAASLALEEVITSVYASYPALDAVARERQIAAGRELTAMGQFDANVTGSTINKGLGYYENYRHDLGVKQYAWGGGQSFAGYRIGRGDFEPWYQERVTNDGGEFKAGFVLPFLRDRDIDKRRAAVFKAQIDRIAAEPLLQLEVIETVRIASLAYWYWVAAGRELQIARDLLALAEDRQAGLEQRVASEDLPEIELVDNERLIASRQAKLVDAQRKLQQATIKLSLFLRDPAGMPRLASADLLPNFPTPAAPAAMVDGALAAEALARRPELRLLDLERRRAQVDYDQAANMMLPAVDGMMTAAQDVGAPSSPSRDKSPLELEAGAMLDVPLQRRAARGEMQTAQGKMVQIAAKRRLVEQKIVVEVQEARTALAANYEVYLQALRSVELARQMEEAERIRFDSGDSNLLLVNLREQATADAELLVAEAAFLFYQSQAELRAALAAELSGQRGP